MNQANVEKLVSRLRYNVGSKPRKLKNVNGPEGRILKIRRTLTALIKYERIELNYARADETRGYVERLIQEALSNGPTHKETNELANFWILEAGLVHKFFQKILPRYENCTTSYTMLHNAPTIYPGYEYKRAVLELRGNIYPSLVQQQCRYTLLHNILLDAARKEHRMEKYEEMAKNLKS